MRNWINIVESFEISTLKERFLSSSGSASDDECIYDLLNEFGEPAEDTLEMHAQFFDYLTNLFRSKIQGNKLMVWRAIGVDDVEGFVEATKSGHDLGSHWTFDKDSASTEYHDGYRTDHVIVLKAFVPTDDVDWFSTFQQNFGHAFEQEVFITGQVFDLEIESRGEIIFSHPGPFAT